MRYNIGEVIEDALWPVTREVGISLIKTMAGELPPSSEGSISRLVWQKSPPDRRLDGDQAVALQWMLNRIHDEAFLAIAKLIVDPQFQKEMVRESRRSFNKDRAESLAAPFRAAVEANKGVGTKKILRWMEEQGLIVDPDVDGQELLIVDPSKDRSQWHRMKKSTVPGKISRLRKPLRSV